MTGCRCDFPRPPREDGTPDYPFRCPHTGRERMTEGRHRQCATEAGYFEAMGGVTRQPEPTREPRQSPKPPQTAEDCVHGGDVAREVECRVCSRETALRPVFACEVYGETMNRRNEHGLMDCSRCGAFTPRPSG